MQIYRFLFFRIYEWGLRFHGFRDLPEYNAIFGLSMLATINLFNIAMAAEVISGGEFECENAKFIAVAVWLGFLILHFVYLARKGRLEKIREEFQGQPAKPIAILVCWAYPLATLAIFFALPLILR